MLSLPSGKFPLRALYIILIASTFAIFIMVWQTWMGILQLEHASSRQEALLNLRADILYNTEKMMTSARVYTRTGQSSWKDEYQAHRQLLEDKLQKIYVLTPQAFSEFGDEVEANKDRLNEIEQASFLLMRQRYRQEGLSLLNSNEYLNFGKELNRNLTELSQRLTEINEAEKANSRRIILSHTLAVVVVLATLLVVWMFCLRLLVRWRTKLLKEIEQRSQVEGRFNEQSHILDKIIENLPVGLFVKNAQHNYRWDIWNRKAEELFGLKAAEVLGTSDFDHFPAHEATFFRQIDEKVMREGKVVDVEEEEITTTTRGTWLGHTIKVPIFNEKGEPSLLMGIVEDITVRKQQASARLQVYAAELEQKNDELEEARSHAEAADKAKTQFLATMSHEIRTPLNGVLGTADLLSRTTLSNEQEDYVRTIRKSGETLLYVINDILDLTKLEARQLGLETIAFDFSRTIEDVIDIHSANASKKELELLLRYAPPAPERIYGDPGRLRQILSNLISNAIKFTETGHILVDVEEVTSQHTDTHSCLKISVKDTGIGINPEHIGKIFERFTQAEASTTRKYGGSGLGLAICKQLVELMGGEIGIESTPGQGSTFWFTLPAQIDTRPMQPLPVASLEGRNVWVVDDNPVNIRILEELLAYWGCTVHSFSSGDEVLTLLATPDAHPCDIAIIDHDMPDMSGGDLAENLRLHPLMATVPLIVFSSRGMRGDAAYFEEKGFNGYLVKPSRPEDIRLMLAALIAQPAQDGIMTRHYINEQGSTVSENDATNITFNLRVLVAEDDAVNQKVVRQMLQELGCTVTMTSSGPVAVDGFKAETYDIVLMDMQMPDMDGPEAARLMRQWEAENGLPRTPIVALTANAMAEHRELCLEAGMDDYMTKPLSRAKLVAQLTTWTGKGVPAQTLPASAETNGDDQDHGLSNEARAELYGIFKTSAAECVDEMENAALFDDDTRWSRAAHRLKGACGTLGYTELAALCDKAETNATGLDKETLLEELKEKLAQLK